MKFPAAENQLRKLKRELLAIQSAAKYVSSTENKHNVLNSVILCTIQIESRLS
jgi:hypothetical protein